MALLEIKDIHKSFGNLNVLNGMDLTVNKGDVIAILGPSGSGKTTLLRCINYLETADAGTMIFNGKSYDLSNTSKKDVAQLRKHTGFVFQNYNLFANKTALQNVTLGLTVARNVSKEEANAIGMQMLEKVGMQDRANHYPSQLSGGQKQRVAIARALSNNPKVLLSDEATSALDPDATESILKLLRDLNKRLGITIILITHEMSVIKSIANRVAVMENGKVVEEGDVYDIFANPKEEITKKFINSSSSLSNITKLIENKTIIPTDCKLVKLTFTRDSVGSATISKISREYNVDVNIMLANVDVVNADALGGIIASIEGTKENVQRAIDFLHESNVKVEVIHHA